MIAWSITIAAIAVNAGSQVKWREKRFAVSRRIL
jgi:hypothetical protein